MKIATWKNWLIKTKKKRMIKKKKGLIRNQSSESTKRLIKNEKCLIQKGVGLIRKENG